MNKENRCISVDSPFCLLGVLQQFPSGPLLLIKLIFSKPLGDFDWGVYLTPHCDFGWHSSLDLVSLRCALG